MSWVAEAKAMARASDPMTQTAWGWFETPESDERHLAREDPAPLATEERQRVSVHGRRPQQLEGPGGLGEAEQTDDLDVYPGPSHPGRDRDPDQAQGQARRKGEEDDGEEPPAPDDGAEALPGGRLSRDHPGEAASGREHNIRARRSRLIL
jgi:hypothetical protein